MWLTVREASVFYKIKSSTIYFLTKKGMPHYRIGSLIRFKKDELDIYFDSHKVTPLDIKPDVDEHTDEVADDFLYGYNRRRGNQTPSSRKGGDDERALPQGKGLVD